MKKRGRKIGSEDWDLADGNSRLSLAGWAEAHIPLALSRVCTEHQTCIWTGSCFSAISCIPPADTPPRPKGLFLISWGLPCCENAAAPPASSHYHCLSRAPTSWLWRGLLAKSWCQTYFWSVVRLLNWLPSAGYWQLFCNFNSIIVSCPSWLPKRGKGPSG